MNSLKVCTLIIKLASLVAGLAVYAEALPAKWVPLAAIAFGIASILKDAANRLGDLLDDGKDNDSYRPL